MSDPQQPLSWTRLVDVVLNKYGHHAFGLTMFLILWFVAVKPEIERNRVDMDKYEQITNKLQVTAELMDRTASRLERLDNDE